MQMMLQTTICDGLAFDPFAFEEDGLGPPEVDVSQSEIAEALVIASMVVVLDEGSDLAFDPPNNHWEPILAPPTK
jgi:hypothetical protein